MPWLPDIPALTTAGFEVIDGPGKGQKFPVQFNPASLEYSVNNEFDSRNSDKAARQFVKKTSAKLALTLVYDTTTTGADVRGLTSQVAKLLEPAKDGSKKFAPKVQFGWGSFSFKGVIEQYKETIDFFSASGVPLRASLALTLASQEVEFQSSTDPVPAQDRHERPDPVAVPPGATPADVAQQMGDPRAARAIADASGAESLTAGASAGLAVGGGVQIGAAAGFSLGVGVGGGIGVGAGIGGGIGGGLSGGIGGGISGGIGGGLDLGASSPLGLSFTATAGPAFAGLSLAPPTPSVNTFDARATLLGAPAASASVGGSASAEASFGASGRAQATAGASLSADVSGRINFPT